MERWPPSRDPAWPCDGRERVRVRRDCHQAQVVSTVQRHLADGLSRNHGAEGGVVRLQQSGARLNCHRLCYLTDLEREILTQGLLHLQFHVLSRVGLKVRRGSPEAYRFPAERPGSRSRPNWW